jgi:hypothetical protein
MRLKKKQTQAADNQREAKKLLMEAMKQPGVDAVMKAYASSQAFVEKLQSFNRAAATRSIISSSASCN